MASHAEGDNNKALGAYSHAEGYNTIVVGTGAHSEGASTHAYGDYSHAAGLLTSASGNYQSVIGISNQPNTNQGAFIIGNGPASGASRSNLLYASGSEVQITGSLVVSAGITGTVTNATNVAVTDTTSGTGPYYLMFADGTTGNRATRVDSSTLQFNATTNTITVPNLAGNASTATTASHALGADNIRIQTQDTTPVTFNITFAGASSGIQSLNVDPTTLTYNPSTSTFTTPIVNSTTAVQGGNGSAATPAFSFSGDTNTGMYNFGADSLGFSTSGTARMVINSSGDMSVGTTSPLLNTGGRGNITINGSSQSILTLGVGGNWKSYLYSDGTNTDLSAAGALYFGTNGGTQRAVITTGGGMGLGVASPTNTAGRFEASNDIVAYSTSDKRWKNNIVKIDSPLEKISQISGVEFDWIEDEPLHGNKGHDVGVIAQEIELVIPEAVQTRESGMKAVQYDKIIPLLIESIKEQQKQIDELKGLVNKLTK